MTDRFAMGRSAMSAKRFLSQPRSWCAALPGTVTGGGIWRREGTGTPGICSKDGCREEHVMGRFFNYDSPFFQFLGKLADLAILNLLFIVCSIPVITAGASMTALASVVMKMREGNEGYIWKSFFASFRQNLKQSTLIWLILLAVAAVLGADFYILRLEEYASWKGLQYLVYVGIVLWLMVLFYVFPLQAKFENTVRGTLRNALLLAVANAPRAILMTAIFCACVLATLYNLHTIVYGTLVWLLFGFAVMAKINAMLQAKIFRRFIPESPEDDSETDETEETGEEEQEEDQQEEREEEQEEGKTIAGRKAV